MEIAARTPFMKEGRRKGICACRKHLSYLFIYLFSFRHDRLFVLRDPPLLSFQSVFVLPSAASVSVIASVGSHPGWVPNWRSNNWSNSLSTHILLPTGNRPNPPLGLPRQRGELAREESENESGWFQYLLWCHNSWRKWRSKRCTLIGCLYLGLLRDFFSRVENDHFRAAGYLVKKMVI